MVSISSVNIRNHFLALLFPYHSIPLAVGGHIVIYFTKIIPNLFVGHLGDTTTSDIKQNLAGNSYIAIRKIGALS